MQQQLWRARWLENGVAQELIFNSAISRVVARVDFRLQAQRAAFHPKDHVDLEEVAAVSTPAWLVQLQGTREAIGATDV